MNVYDANWLAVIAAAIAGFVAGGLWYGPLFGKKWMAAMGFSDADVAGGSMVKIFGLTILLSIVSSAMLAHMFARLGNPPFPIIMMMSTGIALGFVIPSLGINYLYQRQKMALFWIDAGYWLLFYAVLGLVHALFIHGL